MPNFFVTVKMEYVYEIEGLHNNETENDVFDRIENLIYQGKNIECLDMKCTYSEPIVNMIDNYGDDES